MHPTLKEQRPLSPHLQVYRPQITSVLSITHRITGFILSIGALKIAWMLWALAYSPECYAWMLGHAAAWYGQAALVIWSLCFYYHFANGIRHLIWDTGRMLALRSAERGGWFVLLFTVLATAGTWVALWGAP